MTDGGRTARPAPPTPSPASPSLARLLDRRRAARLVDAFGSLAPGGGLALIDARGRPLATTGIEPAGASTSSHPIRLHGNEMGSVEAVGPVPEAVVRALAFAVEAILDEVADRREVALDALERYRELALLYRLSATIGSGLDASAIADQLLAEAIRATRADAAAIVPTAGAMLPATRRGDPVAAGRALGAAEALVPDVIAADRVIIAEAAGSSALLAPLHGPAGVDAALVLIRLAGDAPFAATDERVVRAIADHAVAAVERVRMVERETQRQRLEQELALGRRIQRSLLPQRPPDVPGWSFATRYEAASQVGGDFYDAFRLRDRPSSFGLVMADVTGKGIGAALLMAFARPLIRAITDQYAAPATALAQANRVLVLERPTPLFITVFLGIVDAPSGLLRYAIAGHEPPLVVPAVGRVRRLPGSGALLGAFPTLELAEQTTILRPGDQLLMHTDGATDARGPRGTRFGDVRLARQAGRARGATAEELVGGVFDAVTRFAAGTPAADDIALLGVRRDPDPAAGTVGSTRERR